MRAILHSDLNSYYASVEMMLNPSLRGKAVAVCGSTENRHGIVLAKSELAKMAGVKTGMVNWEAKRCCPNLIMVQPNFEQYIKYSALARNIYGRYTDQIEPYVSHKRGFRMLFDLLSNCKLGRELRCYIGPKPSLNICSDTGFQGRRFERVLLPSERQQVKTELAIAKR